jgi:LysM repeat protein
MDDKGHIKMKINDILNKLDMIAEAPAQPAATPKQNAGTAAGYKGSAGAQAIAKASGVADVNKIKVGQVLTLPDGTKYSVKAGDTLDKIAAANKVGSTAAPPPGGATGADAPSAANEKAKQGIAAGTPAPAADAAPATADSDAAPNNASSSYTGVQTQPDEVARLQQLAGSNTAPNNASSSYTGGQQSTQPEPAAAAPAAPNPDTVAPVVKTGTGGTLTTRDGKPVTSRSNDEIAWASKQPMGGTGQQYPGAGNWDPRTGRDLKAAAQGEKNWQSIKNFFGGKKTPPAGQATQPAPAPTPAPQMTMESELSMIKHLSGLK